MKIVNGSFAFAKVFTDNAEDYALAQIEQICNQPSSRDSQIRVMPDVHPGKVGPIGLTMTVKDTVMPGIVGIDLGCGISLAKLKNKKIEYQKLDTVIRERIPSGFRIRKKAHRLNDDFPYEKLKCLKHIDVDKAMMSLGTLGGGNHFIEVDKDNEGNLYLVIHSGSRSLGKAIAEHYQMEGQKVLKEQGINLPYELTFLTGELFDDYRHDQELAVKYAELNRTVIMDEILKGMKLKAEYTLSCIHNCIEITDTCKMLRKGAISAKTGECTIIPINMRDGLILGIGKGNPDWNYSAPHGSGRLMKRTDVASQYTVSDFKKEMNGIYCSCISKDTLDEAPFAYRGLEEIRDAISETVEIKQVIKPVYNFKAGSKERG